MSSVAETPSVGVSRRPRSGRRPVAGGVAWIVVFAALLAGVVAVNVLVLQLNVRLDGLGGERAQLKADLRRLESQLSSAAAAARLEREAREKLGLVPFDPATMTYVHLER